MSTLSDFDGFLFDLQVAPTAAAALAALLKIVKFSVGLDLPKMRRVFEILNASRFGRSDPSFNPSVLTILQALARSSLLITAAKGGNPETLMHIWNLELNWLGPRTIDLIEVLLAAPENTYSAAILDTIGVLAGTVHPSVHQPSLPAAIATVGNQGVYTLAPFVFEVETYPNQQAYQTASRMGRITNYSLQHMGELILVAEDPEALQIGWRKPVDTLINSLEHMHQHEVYIAVRQIVHQISYLFFVERLAVVGLSLQQLLDGFKLYNYGSAHQGFLVSLTKELMCSWGGGAENDAAPCSETQKFLIPLQMMSFLQYGFQYLKYMAETLEEYGLQMDPNAEVIDLIDTAILDDQNAFSTLKYWIQLIDELDLRVEGMGEQIISAWAAEPPIPTKRMEKQAMKGPYMQWVRTVLETLQGTFLTTSYTLQLLLPDVQLRFFHDIVDVTEDASNVQIKMFEKVRRLIDELQTELTVRHFNAVDGLIEAAKAKALQPYSYTCQNRDDDDPTMLTAYGSLPPAFVIVYHMVGRSFCTVLDSNSASSMLLDPRANWIAQRGEVMDSQGRGGTAGTERYVRLNITAFEVYIPYDQIKAVLDAALIRQARAIMGERVEETHVHLMNHRRVRIGNILGKTTEHGGSHGQNLVDVYDVI